MRAPRQCSRLAEYVAILFSGGATARRSPNMAGGQYPPLNLDGSRAVVELGFLARVEIEKRQDNHQQNDLPKDEYTAIKAAGFVVGVHVNDERPKSNARSQPDNLSFCVPHNNLIFELRT